MSDSEYSRPVVRRGTPRPFSSSSKSDETFETYSGASKSSSCKPVSGVQQQQHRRRVVSGWISIPRSVVLATTLNQKHLERLHAGSLTTIRDVIQEKQRRMETLRTRNQSKSKSRGRTVRPSKVQQIPRKDFYENLLEENLSEIKQLVQRFGPFMRERYKIVPAVKSDEDYEEATKEKSECQPRVIKEISNVESALPKWKHGFIPASTDIVQYKQENFLDVEKGTPTSKKNRTRASRPFTADASLRSQSDKASEARILRPGTSVKTEKSSARKTASETIRFSWQKNPELRKLLPAYPARVVRNRPHVDCMSLKYGVRPVMTPTTQWFPLSFHGEVRGELVTLQSDMYGYQSFAEYGELCKTLNGGMAVVEQSITVGDSIDVKILATDYRKDLLCVAVCENLNSTTEDKHQLIPCNRLDVNDKLGTKGTKWTFSDEIRDVKTGDEMCFTFDALGRIKCSVNSLKPFVVLQLNSSFPRHFALVLGLGVTKIQLLGGRRRLAELTKPDNAYEIVPGIRSELNRPSPYFDYNPSNSHCSFCSSSEISSEKENITLSAKTKAKFCLLLNDCEKQNFSVPYGCDHIKVCKNCQSRVECPLCKAPLCWHSCPLCDTRLQSL